MTEFKVTAENKEEKKEILKLVCKFEGISIPISDIPEDEDLVEEVVDEVLRE